MCDRRLWSQSQDDVIRNLISIHGTNQWTLVAKLMKQISNSYRSSKQIRQRWYNQLSPNISKHPWTTEEQKILFYTHSLIGNRWKDIASKLQGRTDNTVKNHFYSTVRRALRRLDKYYGFKDSTKKIRTLKPAALTYLIDMTRTIAEREGNDNLIKEIMNLLLEFAQEKPTKKNLIPHKKQSKTLYQKIFEIINHFKQTKQQSRQQITETKTLTTQYQQQINNSSQEQKEQNMQNQIQENKSQFNCFDREIQVQSWFSANQPWELRQGIGMYGLQTCQ